MEFNIDWDEEERLRQKDLKKRKSFIEENVKDISYHGMGPSLTFSEKAYVIGWRLKQIRLRKGFTAEHIAKFMGVSLPTFRQMETGKIQLDDYLKLIDFYHCDQNANDFAKHEILNDLDFVLTKEKQKVINRKRAPRRKK